MRLARCRQPLEEHVHPPVAPQPKRPGLLVVGRGRVVGHHQRPFPGPPPCLAQDIPLQTPTTDATGNPSLGGEQQARARSPVRRAARRDDRRQHHVLLSRPQLGPAPDDVLQLSQRNPTIQINQPAQPRSPTPAVRLSNGETAAGASRSATSSPVSSSIATQFIAPTTRSTSIAVRGGKAVVIATRRLPSP